MSWPIDLAWLWLRQELDRWHEAGIEATFWWRDDDAMSGGQPLEQLLALRRKCGVPLALAVIPASCESSLVESICDDPQVLVLQHGYAHSNHAAAGELKLELGGKRNPKAILEDLANGYERLANLFEKSYCPVLVPPWNRIDDQVLEHLSGLGLVGISTYRVRKKRHPAPGLLQVNTHLDPVHWRGGQGFIGVFPSIAMLIQHLAARRTGYRDLDEPSGILSHHLAQNDACWRFVEDLLAFLNNHPATRWTDAREIWALSPAI